MANATKTPRTQAHLFAAVREAQDEHLRLADPHEQARARARLLQAVDREASTSAVRPVVSTGARSRWGWGLGAGLATAACALAVVLSLPEPSDRPVEIATLSFEVDGAGLEAKSMITADAVAQVVTVSDGTRIELAPHGELTIDAIRSNGATVILDHGEVALAVHHEDDTSWRVAAGPWTVHVTGTQFVVAWEPTAEHFRVAVSEGAVRVEGPGGEVAKLGAGEELVRTRIKPDAVAAIDPSLPSVAPVEPDLVLDDVDPELTPEPGPAVEHRTTPKPKPSSPGWSSHFADADYPAAWDALAAQPGGILAEAERANNARTVLDLADVARFTKHASDTRKLLERLRVRFPATLEASEAAFALGRLAADGGAKAKAAEWFEIYLDERPDGSFAGDALGRLMDCYDALGQTDAAESAATRYLAEHRQGPHAAKAEKLLAR